ncbi:MAG: DUF1549 domain-containing protein, partial [Deltaproteobacteria bacterium]|nr:DUF1549 domain-containing protein [Deltaproteobacteria bacterium]
MPSLTPPPAPDLPGPTAGDALDGVDVVGSLGDVIAADDGYGPSAEEPTALDEEWLDRLESRRVDYSAALRTASLRLTGELPTLLEIRFVADAGDPRAAYESLIDSYLASPRFARQMLHYFRDTFRMGGTANLDTAPAFAAQLVFEDRDLNELFTATTGACPTWDGSTMTFEAGDCESGAPVEAGVLTNPHVMRHFGSNLAFRRVRWVQETFACTRFPAEVVEGRDVGGAAPYTAPWPWGSIAGMSNGGRIDFLDTSSVICANCHATMNHLAPLFGRFDADGMWQDDFVVTLPSDGAPAAMLSDWLPPGEMTAWRLGVPARDLASLGRVLAADREVAACTTTRLWNWALGKGDVVTTLSVVPADLMDPLTDQLVAGGHRVRPVLRTIFTHDDFV